MLILCGLPASGKSTRRREWLAEDPDGRIYVNYDEMRASDGVPFSRKHEDEIKARAITTVRAAADAGLSVCIDNTNLSQRVREMWRQLGRSLSMTVVEEEIDTPVEECVRRDRLRTGKARVGRAVIENMALRYGFIDWPAYERIVIVDVDGTLANGDHRVHYVTPRGQVCPEVAKNNGVTCAYGCKVCGGHGQIVKKKDWRSYFAACPLDTPHQPIIDLVNVLSDAYTILIVSGRDMSQAGIATEDWLDGHGVCYDHLFMRPGGDGRVDVDVKKEILEYLPKDQVTYVIDDRPSVLRMWRAEGLTTLAVGPGEEF
jgi:predicted kinase